MTRFEESDLLKMAAEITESVVGSAGDKAPVVIHDPDATAAFLATVFEKLRELNASLA
ncbi:MAG: hypothetical protein IJ092_03145 [Atopobiaceae bacterium]|nr:hypothetical protein [Atopobiaceae bacterium]